MSDENSSEFTETQRVEINGRQFDLIPVPSMAVERFGGQWLGRMTSGSGDHYDLRSDDERVYVLREVNP